MRRAQTAAVAALLALAACSESGGGITRPDTPASPPPPNEVAQIPCTADVHARTLTCSGDASASGVRGDRVIGGQHVNVTLTSTNVAYDAGTQIFSADITVQNLLVQRMGSDGATVSGVKVFFASGPSVTSGSGFAEVNNPDGFDTFTGSAQPYFYYAGALAPNAVSPVKHWQWKMPASVGTFAFTLYVSAPIVPAIVFEMTASGNRDIYRMGIDGNDATKLSTSVLTDAYPTVSQGTVVFTSYRDGNAELYSVPLKGGTETRLTATTGTNETTPSLSPDGTKLAWAAGAPGAITKIYYGAANATGGTRADPNSGDAIESSPNWASSTRLAWTSSAGGSADIYNVTLGGAAGMLTGSAYADVEGAWSPDGKKLAFASNRTGDTELYLYDSSNASVTRLTTRTGSDGAPTWLADGRIVWTCVTGTAFHLCIMDPAIPGVYTTITTPYNADHASGVRF